MQQRKINKFCRVLFGDIFIVPFLGPALGYMIALCSPGWGNLVAFDWNDLPVGREFDCKFLKNVKSPPQRGGEGGTETYPICENPFSRSAWHRFTP